jgi:NodT family efflux transporter outer membrane factor (OMF) lipoprotein
MPDVGSVSTSSVAFTGDEPWARWWEVFHDPALDSLVDRALVANHDLRSAYARVMAARAVVRQEFAGLLPNISAIGAYNYVKLPGVLAQGSQAATSGPLSGQPFQTAATVGVLSYEIDIWGRVRRLIEAANADEGATEEDRKGVELTVIADVAQAYFDVGEADAQLAIAREAVATREETLAIVRRRFDTGFATELELRRAEGEVAAARAEVPRAEISKAVAEHRLAILIGHMPDLRFDGRPPAEFELPPEIPLGSPAALLERRPDIRAAEARLVGQNARIGSKIAEYFPKLSIYGLAGIVTIDWHSVVHPDGTFWAIGPSLSIPIFQGGRTTAEVDEARELRTQAEADFQSTVLRAFGELADSVVRLVHDRRVRDAETEQVEATRRAIDVARLQYTQGFVTYLDVLDAQRSHLAARQSLVRSQRALLGDLVQLGKALGGGWRTLEPDEFQRKLVEPILPHSSD